MESINCIKTVNSDFGQLSQFEIDKILPILIEFWNDLDYEKIVTAEKQRKYINQYCEAYRIKTYISHPKIYKINGPVLRTMFRVLRENGTFWNVIADNRGYFKTRSIEQIESFIDRTYQKANSYNVIAKAINRHLSIKKNNQTSNYGNMIDDDKITFMKVEQSTSHQWIPLDKESFGSMPYPTEIKHIDPNDGKEFIFKLTIEIIKNHFFTKAYRDSMGNVIRFKKIGLYENTFVKMFKY